MKQVTRQLTIPEDMANLRLDKALALLVPEYSRAKLVEWLKDGGVLVDGKTLAPKLKVAGLEQITINVELKEDNEHKPEPIKLNILFEDEHLLILNKKAGQVVHPAAGNHQGTLLNGLLHHSPDQKLLPRAGIVHRLDKDTTGLMVVAKTLETHHQLIKMMQDREIHRHYYAVCQGYMISGGAVETQMGRHPGNRLKMAVVADGKEALTHYLVKKRFSVHTLVDIKLDTGRTHQIRVHMSHIKHPLVGDPLYGARAKLPKGCSDELRHLLGSFKRQALHAYRLAFTHPMTQEMMDIEAPIPEDMQNLIDALTLSLEPSLS